MSTKHQGEKMSREVLQSILTLLKGAQRYTSREVVAILQSDYSPILIRNTLYRLQRQAYLKGGAYQGYQLTSKGLERLSSLHFQQLQQTQTWDHKWRLVIYDVPEQQRQTRDHVRRLIKKLGFIQLQQSVWAHPLPCLDEFMEIRSAASLQDQLLLLEVEHTDNYAQLAATFRDIYPGLGC